MFKKKKRKKKEKKKNVEKTPKGVALSLKRICDSDSKFEKHSAEYQKYLIFKDYKPSKLKKKFLVSEIILEKKPKDLKLKVTLQLRVI